MDQLVELEGVRADLVFVRTPDGSGRVELPTFQAPMAQPRGAELIGEVVQYEGIYRHCHVRGPAGGVIGLVEMLR